MRLAFARTFQGMTGPSDLGVRSPTPVSNTSDLSDDVAKDEPSDTLENYSIVILLSIYCNWSDFF